MKASDLKLFCRDKLFIWTPPGYTIIGFFHKGHNYAVFSFKSPHRYCAKPSMKGLGKFKFLNVERERILEE
jgi:hypothetical protein